MMKYRCMKCDKFWLKTELIRERDRKHIDYVCSTCGRVLICNGM